MDNVQKYNICIKCTVPSSQTFRSYFLLENFSMKELNEVEVKKQYRVEVS
jgi:hypothetical protein